MDVLLKLGEKSNIDVLGSVTVTADGSSQKCEAQKNADLVLQNQFAGEKISHSLSASVLALPGMRLSAFSTGITWNFWKNRAFRSSGSALSMISICQMIWMVFSLAAVIRSFMQKALEENETIRNEIRRKAEEDMTILAECGGYLYLLKELEDENGTGYEMAGVFSGKGFKKGKNSHFGYITVRTEKDSLYLKAGETIKGHEFHYWESTQDENELKMQAKKPTGKRSWPCVTVKIR